MADIWPHIQGLLLLPPPPTVPSPPNLAAAYGASIRYVVEKMHIETGHSSLDLGLPLHPTSADDFSIVAQLVHAMYSLISSITYGLGVAEDDPMHGTWASVDVRVLLIRYNPDINDEVALDAKGDNVNAVTSLPHLVQAERDWTDLFVPEGEQAAIMFHHFRRITNAKIGSSKMQDLCTRPQRIPGGIVLRQHSPSMTSSSVFGRRSHDRVIVVVEFEKFDAVAKTLLTMSLFLMKGLPVTVVSLEMESGFARHERPQRERESHSRQLVLKPSSEWTKRIGAESNVSEAWHGHALSFLAAISCIAPAPGRKSRTSHPGITLELSDVPLQPCDIEEGNAAIVVMASSRDTLSHIPFVDSGNVVYTIAEL